MGDRKTKIILLVHSLGLWGSLTASALWGQPVQPPATSCSPVLAWLGSQTITQSDLDFALGRLALPADGRFSSVTGPRSEEQPLSPGLQAHAIELIAQQHRALVTLRALGQAAAEADIDAAIRAGAAPEQREWPLEKITAALCQYYDLDPQKYRDLIDFRLTWPRYLNRHLTEENLRKHFEQQRSRFDGSRFKVDLITIATPVGHCVARTQAEQKLVELRQRLLEAPDGWDRLSASASSSQEMQVVRHNWVRGWGDMVPELVTPLLTMAAGELSPPLHTASGVHLLRYGEQQTGSLQLDAVRAEVRAHMLIFLLEYLARPNQNSLPLVENRQP